MPPDLPPTVQQDEAQATREVLLQKVAFLGPRPFQVQVVQSPWHAITDAPSLHKDIKERIRTLLDQCGQEQAIRCLTATAPPGYGKTHLLAWTRQLLDQRKDAVFVYVPPYNPGSPGGPSPEQHVMRAALDSLWLRSRRQQASFELAVRTLLVECYDGIIDSDSSSAIKDTLRAGTFWSRLFRRSRLRIGPQGLQDQLAGLQRAFSRRAFLERAFRDFSQRSSPGTDGVEPDRDTFVAACLLTCGDARQRWHADRWLRGDRLPLDVLEPFHLDQPCQGTEKIRNGLFTLHRLLKQNVCLAFDQLEDTYLSLREPGNNEATRFTQMLGILLRNLTVMPGFCLLFACQQSVWQDFARVAPPQLIDRMTEGHGAHSLRALDDATAQEVIRERLRVAVWEPLGEGPPEGEPCFPFTVEELRRLRIDTGGELRAFLQRAQGVFEKRLSSPVRPLIRPPLHLTSVEPREVISHEPTVLLIRGENIPNEVKVFFDGQPAPPEPVCRPGVGEIDVTTPTELVGDIEVRVEAADDPKNRGSLTLRFVKREVPRPYCKHIDRQKLRACREQLKLTQKDAAEMVGTKQPYISKLETGRWSDAPDDLYARLAESYGFPLSYFLKGEGR
jgi:hypothetical protein